jgi:hypothetical protein
LKLEKEKFSHGSTDYTELAGVTYHNLGDGGKKKGKKSWGRGELKRVKYERGEEEESQR